MLQLEIHDDVVTTLEKVRSETSQTVEIEIPEGSVLFDNIINLKLLNKEAASLGKQLTLITKDEIGKNLINMLNGDSIDPDGFVTKEFSTDELGEFHGDTPSSSIKNKRKINKPSISLPEISIKNPLKGIKLPKSKGLVIGGLILLTVLLGGFFAVRQVPEAEVKVLVTSQPLIKSVTIKVSSSESTSAENLILKGETVQATVTETETIETTGEKIVGERAEGSITIYNRTNSEISLNDGTVVTFKGSGGDFNYTLDDDVTVPAETLQDPLDPASPSIPGEAEADVTASDVGEDYNIDDGESLEFEDYKKAELAAAASGDIDGGSSEIVKIVTEEDLAGLSDSLAPKLIESGETLLKSKTVSKRKLVTGSTSTQVTSEEYSGEVGDELDEVELTQQVTAVGLSYSTDDLNDLLDKLVEDFVPEGFKLSDEERDVNVEILGNSDNTVLSSAEADLQVTLKTFVVPSIDEDKVKKDLAGKSLEEAQKVLGSIRNVDSYELKVSPNIPFFNSVPADEENISLDISLE